MEQSSTHNLVKILLVDDDEEDYFIIKRLFAMMRGIDSELDWVSSSAEAIKAIKEAKHDAYLIDYRLDALTGLDVLQQVNAIQRSEPFILLTGVGDHDIERESLQLAASDYLVKKNLTSDNLARAIYYALGRKEQEKQKISELVELNKTKDEFISIASHQLRTPATAVKQYVAMVVDGIAGGLTERQSVLLQKAYESNERQLAIINDLLKVAQIDAGRMELGLASVNLSQLIRDAVADFIPAFDSIEQTLICDIDKDIFVTVDENAIRMVIDNLLENAKKYSESDSSTSVILSREGNDGVVIKVVDEGVGVADPSKLFQKFSRIENKLSTEVGGTGLGLYWAQSIIRLHGGELTYEHNQPRGSQFIISLPIS
jgi:signal transduction histidine kinase